MPHTFHLLSHVTECRGEGVCVILEVKIGGIIDKDNEGERGENGRNKEWRNVRERRVS